MAMMDTQDPTLSYYGGGQSGYSGAPDQLTPEQEAQRAAILAQTSQLQPGVPEELPTIWPQAQTGGGGGDTSGGNNGQGLFNPALYAPFQGTAPSYQAPQLPGLPQFQTPNYRTPPAFSYQDFKAPTLDEASQQPGYAFGVQQGEQALQQSRAAQGLLRTGGTLKNILDYGRNAATQNYSNVLNQDLGIYNTNRQGAVQAYNTNYQTQYADPNNQSYATARDALSQANLGYQTNAANAQHVADTSYNANWQKYLNDQNIWFNNQNSSFSKYLSLAQLGAANA